MNLPELDKCKIAIIGLGYVGLPLAIEFEKTKISLSSSNSLNREIIGFDISEKRIEELKVGYDRTNEIGKLELFNAEKLLLTNDKKDLLDVDIFIVTVPTPIDESNLPDLLPLKNASLLIGRIIRERTKKNIPIIIYESTVYPGATEEICIPCIEKESNLKFNKDFVCGYSPERINPGDKIHSLTNIIKVTSGSTKESSLWINELYGSIIKAGTHLAPSIKVAEAAKVIENTQRDLNIALVNELAMIFRKLEIDTLDVLEAAETKWNFLPFRPGLVGGHCIGVDPYYLTYQSQKSGYYPQVVLSGRRINDSMGEWIISQLIIEMSKRSISLNNAKVKILGLTFKENCPDLRNTKVISLINNLKNYSIDPYIVDPWADKDEAMKVFNIKLNKDINSNDRFDVVIGAVSHKEFKDLKLSEWENMLTNNGIFLDLKGMIPRSLNPIRI
tara:strand:- start:1655 stop:2989 length:1335 start_codon:yes stop_codon:yes gene_type:complete